MTSKNKKSSKAASNTDKARKEALAKVSANVQRLEAQEAKTAPTGGKAKAAQEPKPAKPAKEKKPKKVSGLDAAALILAESKTPMNMKQVFAETQSRKLWTTKGATPEATLYAAVIREIAAKGKDSRFKKTDRGLFTANRKGA